MNKFIPVIIFFLFGIMMLLAGIVFKLMHWFSSYPLFLVGLISIGIAIIVLVFLLIQKYRQVRHDEKQTRSL